jgi:hypothetical protein
MGPASRLIQLDMAAVIADCTPFGGQQDTGQNVVRLRFDSEYNLGSSLLYSLRTISALDALP